MATVYAIVRCICASVISIIAFYAAGRERADDGVIIVNVLLKVRSFLTALWTEYRARIGVVATEQDGHIKTLESAMVTIYVINCHSTPLSSTPQPHQTRPLQCQPVATPCSRRSG